MRYLGFYVLAFIPFISCIQLWSSPGSLPSTIPAACRATLASDIACAPRFVRTLDIVKEVPLDSTFLTQYCNSTCSTSWSSYLSNVQTRCGNTTYDFGSGSSTSASALIAPYAWARDTACVGGSNGTDFCYTKVMNQSVGTCDNCSLKYFAELVSSDHNAGKMNEDSFSSILSSCGASPTRFPHSTISAPSTTVTSSPTLACWGGTKQTTQKGDTCQSVAAANGMALDRFLALNGIDFNCHSFVPGQDVCIRDSCKLHTIQPNETCANITDTYGFTFVELEQWNPVLESGCDNTTAYQGRSICVSPPGTDHFDFTPTVTWNNVFSTFVSTDWVPLPTQGTPFNVTKTTWDVPTTTGTWTATVDPTIAAYFANCPLTDQMYDDGFDWPLLSNVCSVLLSRYCEPVITGTPLPSTTFPSSCFPPYPDPTDV